MVDTPQVTEGSFFSSMILAYPSDTLTRPHEHLEYCEDHAVEDDLRRVYLEPVSRWETRKPLWTVRAGITTAFGLITSQNM